MHSREATNTNFIDFGLTWLGLEPMIYHTRGEHANHYTTRCGAVYLQDPHNINRIISNIFVLYPYNKIELSPVFTYKIHTTENYHQYIPTRSTQQRTIMRIYLPDPHNRERSPVFTYQIHTTENYHDNLLTRSTQQQRTIMIIYLPDPHNRELSW